MQRLEASDAVVAHRAAWTNRGAERPAFAEPVAAGQRSVWDFPRPPRMAPIAATVSVRLGEHLLASSDRAVEVMETASAPTVYLPPEDVRENWLTATDRQSHCEWKGVAVEYVCGPDAPEAWLPDQGLGWRYLAVYPEFEALYGWYAFYPQRLACFVGAEQAAAQPGGYYGGWVTKDLAGPIKGAPASAGW